MTWTAISMTGFSMFAVSLLLVFVPVRFTDTGQRKRYVDMLAFLNIMGVLLTFYGAAGAMVDR